MDNNYLKSILHYNPDTGIWTWLISKGSCKAGKQAGTLHKHGYCLVKIDRRKYKSSRLPWLYMTGAFPSYEVDHVDTNNANDIWSNLRLSNRSQQNCNKKVYCTNKLGMKGVRYCKNKKKKKYQARVRSNKVTIHVGYFKTAEEAKAARDEVAKKLHGEFFRS